jgi:hypothetical protein
VVVHEPTPVGPGRGALLLRTSSSSIPLCLCRLGGGGIMEKLAAWAEAGADDAMLARREKAIFGFKHNTQSTADVALGTGRHATSATRTSTSGAIGHRPCERRDGTYMKTAPKDRTGPQHKVAAPQASTKKGVNSM